MPYKEQLKVLFSFKICHSKLKLWAVKERFQNGKIPVAAWAVAFGMSKLNPLRNKI